MDSSESLHLDEHLARLLAAYDQGMDQADSRAATIDLPAFQPGERRVEPLSGSNLHQGSFTELLPDASRGGESFTASSVAAPEVHRVGRFELRKQLGRGGCGIVFLAHDPKLKRDVALKIPRPELMLSPDARKRLVREATAAAAFDHPNLVPVYETGEIGPVCFIATVFCPGITLSEWLDRQAFPVPVRQAARLVAQLAEAVQHAHDRGVLHRDLKPNNVILQEVKQDPGQQDAPPGACPLRGDFFTPRVVDFGLAKLQDQGPSETATRQVLGTPKYMAPEQAQAKHEDVGPEADVYALGGILYEMLTGRAPYEGETDVEVLRQCIEGNLTQPRSLRKDVPRDLEAICIKALAKTPARRYRTAIDLADDLRRFLDGLPTLARPLNFLGRASRWLRRNDQLFALVTVSTICLILLATGLVNAYQTQKLQVFQNETQVQDAERGRQEQARNYVRHVRNAFHLWQSGQRDSMRRSLHEARHAIGESGSVPEFATGYLTHLMKQPDGLVEGSPKQVRSVAVIPGGRWLATGHTDGTLRVWQLNPLRPLKAVKAHENPINTIVVLGGTRFLTAGSPSMRAWEIGETGEVAELPLKAVTAEITAAVPRNLLNRGGSGNWHKGIATPDGEVQLLDRDGVRIRALAGSGVPIRGLDSSALAPLIAAVCGDDSLIVWNLETDTRRVLRGIDQHLYDVAFHQHSIFVAAEDGLHVLSDESDPAGSLLADRPAAVSAISTRVEGTEHVVAYGNGTVEVFGARGVDPKSFPAKGRQPIVALKHPHAGPPLGVELGVDHVSVWEFGVEPRLKLRKPVKATAADLTTTGDSLAVGEANGRVTVWSLSSGEAAGAIDTHHGAPIRCLSFSDNGRWIALPAEGNAVGIWFVGEQSLPLKVVGHPEGTLRFRFLGDDRLVSAGRGCSLKTWNLSTLREEHTLLGHIHRNASLAVSPDLRTLASGSTDGEVKLWDLRTGQELLGLKRHSGPVTATGFAGDGKFLLTGSGSRGRGELAFWDAEIE